MAFVNESGRLNFRLLVLNFIKKAMKLTFFLQLKIPHSQTGLLDINKYVSAGGGFGPVSLIL